MNHSWLIIFRSRTTIWACFKISVFKCPIWILFTRKCPLRRGDDIAMNEQQAKKKPTTTARHSNFKQFWVLIELNVTGCMAHEACNRWRCLGARMTRNGSQFKSCFRFGIFAIHFPLDVEIRMWTENFLPEWTLRQNDTLSSSLSHSDRAFVRCFALLL